MANSDSRLKMERTIAAVKTTVYRGRKARNRPSFYAPPLAWAVADFTRSLVEDEAERVPHRTGLIVVSDECSLSSIREVSRTAVHGTISPLRFAGASPSIVVGLAALEQGIRGPTVCLTMPPAHASNALLATINYWLEHCNLVSVIAIAHHKLSEKRDLFRGLLASSVDDELRRRILELIEPEEGGTTCSDEVVIG